jgi:flagellar biogenesis protein FliO
MDDSEQAGRPRQNAIAVALLAIILLGGAWLFRRLSQSSALLHCLSRGVTVGKSLDHLIDKVFVA